jgi:hypothetical protein
MAAMLLGAPVATIAADDLKVSQLEQDVRNLQRQLQAQSQQIEELQRQLARPDLPRPLPPSIAAATTAGLWVDASRWQRLQVGMSELEVISLLGPPTAMRVKDGDRVLLYAMEIGASGFLGGSVTLRERVVFSLQKPVLQ